MKTLSLEVFSVLILAVAITLFNRDLCGNVTSSCSASTLLQVHTIFRHGNRTPFENVFRMDPHGEASSWPEGWAQLNQAGKKAQYNLGQYFRGRYDGFLSKKYSPVEVFVRSSDVDRTIASALLNLAGLFPPEDDDLWDLNIQWQPIPVHSISSEIDNKINFNTDCPKYKLRLQQLMDSTIVAGLNNMHQDLYDYLTMHTGRVVSDFTDVAAISDSLYIQGLAGKELPNWTSKALLDRMTQLSILPFVFITFTEEMIKLRAGPLLYEIIHTMELMSGMIVLETNAQRKLFPTAKLHMYSGHDTTVAALLNGLGIYDKAHMPDYAATIMIELHLTNEGVPFVKVFYRNNQDTKEYEIPGCGEICDLAKLKETLASRILSDLDFPSACQIQESDFLYDFTTAGEIDFLLTDRQHSLYSSVKEFLESIFESILFW